MSKYELTAKEREWMEKRLKRCDRCTRYSPNLSWCRCIDNFKTDAYSLVPDYRDALEFEARAKVMALRTDISELPCVRGDKKSCPLKKPGVGCGDWCRLRLAHIKTEEEMGHAKD